MTTGLFWLPLFNELFKQPILLPTPHHTQPHYSEKQMARSSLKKLISEKNQYSYGPISPIRLSGNYIKTSYRGLSEGGNLLPKFCVWTSMSGTIAFGAITGGGVATMYVNLITLNYVVGIKSREIAPEGRLREDSHHQLQ